MYHDIAWIWYLFFLLSVCGTYFSMFRTFIFTLFRQHLNIFLSCYGTVNEMNRSYVINASPTFIRLWAAQFSSWTWWTLWLPRPWRQEFQEKIFTFTKESKNIITPFGITSTCSCIFRYRQQWRSLVRMNTISTIPYLPHSGFVTKIIYQYSWNNLIERMKVKQEYLSWSQEANKERWYWK